MNARQSSTGSPTFTPRTTRAACACAAVLASVLTIASQFGLADRYVAGAAMAADQAAPQAQASSAAGGQPRQRKG